MKIIDNFLVENKNFKIYLDLDGVLTDFDKQVEKFGYGNTDQIESKYGKDFLWKLIVKKGIGFWSELEWMPDGKKLWLYLKKFNPTILTAYLAGSKDSIKGKKIWIKKNLGYVDAIICLRKEKQNYSSSNSILIDDKEKNIEEWKQKGGIGILHINSKNTISKVKKVLS